MCREQISDLRICKGFEINYNECSSIHYITISHQNQHRSVNVPADMQCGSYQADTVSCERVKHCSVFNRVLNLMFKHSPDSF